MEILITKKGEVLIKFVQQVYGHWNNDKVIEDTFVFPDKVS